MATPSFLPTTVKIERIRGDTFPVRFTLKDTAGVAVNLTGFTGFLLTVDTREFPPDASTNLFQLTGAIVSPATSGMVDFAISDTQSNQTPSTYFYDAQFLDASGKRRTFARGEWVVEQDITKS